MLKVKPWEIKEKQWKYSKNISSKFVLSNLSEMGRDEQHFFGCRE